MLPLTEGCAAFLVDNPHPFMVLVHVGAKTRDGLWECELVSKIHVYQTCFLADEQLCRIQPEDELTVELYTVGMD